MNAENYVAVDGNRSVQEKAVGAAARQRLAAFIYIKIRGQASKRMRTRIPLNKPPRRAKTIPFSWTRRRLLSAKTINMWTTASNPISAKTSNGN